MALCKFESLFEVDKDVAKASAQRVVDRINSKRERLRLAEVKRCLDRRFFGTKLFTPKTYEQAEMAAENCCTIPDWHIIYGRQLSRAESIVAACSVAVGDTVWLSAVDAEMVCDNLPPIAHPTEDIPE